MKVSLVTSPTKIKIPMHPTPLDTSAPLGLTPESKLPQPFRRVSNFFLLPFIVLFLLGCGRLPAQKLSAEDQGYYLFLIGNKHQLYYTGRRCCMKILGKAYAAVITN
ncbi:hypothetical protein QWY85_00665 [Neolewinella lacunae]|uniref:Uncharacterized protein n=1 Tax=Neolewinella lacunae TaxID=1517758 RepID=A0A923PN26_9BACT|nr:hypothetical protein [Neolewinella lacunae]MBC6995435.1 hypothetical protein [Neolewinella lacunae]MDN3633145.1 hypothetical protein [Neolewinella lacunae]